MELPTSSCHGVLHPRYGKGSLETCLESSPAHYRGGTGGGVLPSLCVWRGCHWGGILAIDITCLTVTPHNRRSSNTHTHLHSHSCCPAPLQCVLMQFDCRIDKLKTTLPCQSCPCQRWRTDTCLHLSCNACDDVMRKVPRLWKYLPVVCYGLIRNFSRKPPGTLLGAYWRGVRV